MSTEDLEQLRSNIWDHIYANGDQPISEIAEKMQLTVPAVVGLVEHAWFAVNNEVVSIAKEGG